jgi:hypothetical protein
VKVHLGQSHSVGPGGTRPLDSEELIELFWEVRPTWWKAVKGGLGCAFVTLILIGGIVWITGHETESLPSVVTGGWPVLWSPAIPFSYWLQKRRFERLWINYLMRSPEENERFGNGPGDRGPRATTRVPESKGMNLEI